MITALSFAVALVAVSPAQQASAQRVFEARPGVLEFTGDLIVRPLQSLSAADRARALAMVQPRARRHEVRTDEFIVAAAAGPEIAGAPEQRMADQLMASGLFQYAHPNWLVTPVAEPNDPLFNNQWHHAMIAAPAAWELHTGNPSVIVAVADTGIIAHEDLTNRVPGYNAVSQVPELLGGDMIDINGHGTHVAGCAAARGNNAIGVAGVGWNLSIMPIRVSELPGGNASFDALLSGARWAAENGALAVSVSYSGIGYSAIETTGEYIRSLGASLLWAAGNAASDHAGWDFEHVLVIGSSDPADGRSGFSGYGRGVDCFAPGSSILSTVNSGGYGYASGTSMATPVANGALGMIRSANPALTAAHAEYILLRTCDAWGGAHDTDEHGFGRINLRRAIEEALSAFTPQPPEARTDRARGVTGQVFELDVLHNDYDPNMDALEVAAIPAFSSMGDALTLLPGGGPGGRDAVRVDVPPGAAPGERSFTYTLREPASGAVSQATVFIEALTPVEGENPASTEPGVEVAYYAVGSLGALPDWAALTPYMSGVVETINYESTDGEFAGSGLADQVGAVYDGWLEIPNAGLWTLSISSDDGSKMHLNGELLVDNDGLHGMETRRATQALAAGKHRLRVEFFENGGGAGLIMRWSGPGRSTEPVPAWALSHGQGFGVGDLNRDGTVNGADLGMLLAAWGAGGGPADIDGNGTVNGADLGALLANWG